MHYGKIETCDTANGEGIRVTLFVSGCRRHCPDCFNPETWDFNYGKEFTQDTTNWILELLKPDHITGLTLLGGEPFEPENQETVYELLSHVREVYPNKSVWAYTGCTWETDLEPGGKYWTTYTPWILSSLDVLVDGEFQKDKRNLMLKFRGSENQRVLDMQSTLLSGHPVLYMD